MEFEKGSKKISVKKNAKNTIKTPTQLKRKRNKLFSRVSINVPLAPSIMMILPNVNAHENQQNSHTEKVKTEGIKHDKLNDESTPLSNTPEKNNEIAQQLQDKISVEEASSTDKNITPKTSTTPIHSGHHLSATSSPSIIYMPVTKSPTNTSIENALISPAVNLVTTGTQAPHTNSNLSQTPMPITFVVESIVGKYGTLQVDSSGQYQFTLNTQSQPFIALTDKTLGTDTFTLYRTDGSTFIVHIPVTGKQDQALISGDLSGNVTEDTNVDQQGLLQVSGKLDIVDPDQGESGLQAETIQGLYGVITTDSQGHWQYQVDNSQAVVQQLLTGGALHESIDIHTIDGTVQTLDLTIGGTDDNATISGIDIGNLTEDLTLQTSGKLTVNDLDAGESHFSSGDIIGLLGTLHLQENGNWSYDLDNSNSTVQSLKQGATTQDIITVQSADGSTHQVTITVNGINDKAVITGTATASLTEDKDLMSGAILHADGQLIATDPDAGQSQFTADHLQGQYGEMSINSNGHWSYTAHNAGTAVQGLKTGEQLTETLLVHSIDGTEQKVTVTIDGTDDKPVITTITASTAIEGATATTGTITSTDKDLGDTSTFTTTATVAGFTLNTDGTYTFDTVNGANSAYEHLTDGDTQTITIPVTVTDTAGNSDLKDLIITVIGTNDKPVLGTISAQSTDEDGAKLTGQLTSTDVDDHETATYTSPTIDGFVLNSDGSYTFDSSHGAYQHLAAGQEQTVTIPVTVTDQDGGTDTHNLVITVHGSQDASIIAGTDSGITKEDSILQASGTLTIADKDDGQDHFQAVLIQAAHGTLSLKADGSWTYHLDNNNPDVQALGTGNGSTTSSLTDIITISGADGTTHDISVTINGTNDAPTISTITAATATENASATTGSITSTDTDTGDTSTFTTTATVAGFTLNNDGTYTFDTINGASGAYEHLADGDTQKITIPVTVTDGSGGTDQKGLVITVTGTNDKPILSAISAQSTNEDDVTLTGKFTTTDIDDHETATYTASTVDGFTLHTDGSYSFDPSHSAYQHLAAGQAQTITIPITVTDQSGATDTKNMVITVHGINDATTLTTPDLAAKEDGTSVKGTALFTDVDTTDTHSFTVSNMPNSEGAVSIDSKTGEYTFTPGTDFQALAAGETKDVSFIVTINDGHGGTDTEQVTVTVTGTNDAPTLAVTNLAANEDGLSVKGTATFTDVDLTDTHSFTVSNMAAGEGTVSIDATTGEYTFTPGTDFQALAAGKIKDVTFDVTINDGHGGSDTQQVIVSVTGTNDNPIITDIRTGSIDEGTGKYYDMSPDFGKSRLTSEALYADGKIEIVDADTGQSQFDTKGGGYNYAGQYGRINLHQDGTWHYMVDIGHNGFTTGTSTTSAATAIDQLGDGQSLTDTITVYSKDGTAHDVVITIHGDNDKPYCSSDVHLNSGIEDTAQILTLTQLLQNTVDVDKNDVGQLSIENLRANHGSIAINTDGSFTFTPDKDYNGQVQFNYDVKDAHGGVTHTSATTTLSAVSDKAVITGDTTGSVTEDGKHHTSNAGVTTELANGSLHVIDPDAGESGFRYSQFGEHALHDPFGGFLRIDRAGSWGYSVPNSALQSLAAGQVEKVQYEVTTLGGDRQIITIDVVGTNDIPTVTSHVLAGTEDTAHTFTANEFGFTDVDAGAALDHISITALPDALEGVLTLNGATVSAGDSVTTADIGHLVFTPTANFNGVANFGYTVNDGSANSAPATMQLNVASTNDISVISGDTSGALNEGNIGDVSTATGHLAITDVDVTDTPTFPDVASTATTYGHIAMVNGQWKYTVDQSKIQDLDPNDNDVTKHQVTDHHTFTASDGSTQVVDIVIKGTNDKPIIESAHAAPAGSSSTLKIDDFEMVSAPTGANIDVAPSEAENAARWGTDQVEVGVGMKLVGLYKPGSDQNWIQSGHEATITTGHSGAGGYSMVDSHGWWAANHVPDAVNTGSGGATGHGNAWTGGIAVFEAPDGTQHIGIVNRVCAGGGSTEHDYLYFHSYSNLHPGASIIKGQGTAGETITVKDDQGHAITTAVVDTHGHWEVAAAALGNGQHTLHIENAAGQSSPDRIYDIKANGVVDITPAGLTAEIKEDTAHTIINGELRTSDADHGDNPVFVAQADHATKYGHFSIDAAGKYHYTIDNNNANVNHLGVNQSIQEHITVTSKTADGEIATSEVIITINGSVDAPTLSASAATAQQGSLVSLNLQAALTDTGGDAETLTLKISGLPDTATLNHGTYDSVAKYWVLHASDLNDLKLDMKDPNFHGDLHFNVTATATSGGESESTTQSVSLHVNAPPVVASAITDTETEGGTTATVDLLQGATDPDNAALSIAAVTYAVGSGALSPTLPAGVTLGGDGHTLTIDPSHATFNHLAAGTSENITVSYEITDGAGGLVHQTATLTVTGTNDGAVIGGQDIGAVQEDVHINSTGFLTASGTLSVVDPDTGENSFEFHGYNKTALQGTYGTLHISPNGDWGYRADNAQQAIQSLGAGKHLQDVITITSKDGTHHDITITINGTNDGPTITTVALTGTEDTDYTFSVGNFGFTDIDTGDTLAHVTITDLPDPTEGILLLNGVAITANQDIDNADISHLTFKPTANFNGDVHFKYTVNDGSVDSTEATGTLTVASVNDTTTVVGTTNTTAEDTDITITKAQLLAGSSDIDGDALDINSVSVNGSHGTITDNHDGTWTLHPDTNFKGDIALSYNVNDGHANVANHMTVSVASVTDAADISLSVSSDKGWMTDSGHHLSIDALHNTDGKTDRPYGCTLSIELGVTLTGKADSYHNSDVIAQYGTHLKDSTGAQTHRYSDTSGWGGRGVTLTNPHSVTIWIAGRDPVETHIDLTDGKPHRLTVVVENDEDNGKKPTTSIFDNGQPVTYADGTSSESMPLHTLGGSGSNQHYSGFSAGGDKFPTDFTYGGGNPAVPKFIVDRAGSTELSVGGGRNPISLGDGTHANGYENGHIIWQAGSTVQGGNVPPITPLVATFDHVSVSKTALTAAQVAHGPLGELGLPATDVIIDLGVAGGSLVDHSGHQSATNFGSQQLADDSHHLTINASVTPHDADDALQSVHLQGLPIGTTVSDGTHTHTIDATDQKDGLDIKDWKLGSLDVTIPTGVNHNAIITVNAVTQNANGTTAHSESSASIILDPAHAGDVIISAVPIHGVEDQGPYDLNLTAIDPADTHAAITFAVSGLPAGATLSAGSYDAITKTWTITPSETNGLQITLPKDFSGSVTPHITASSSAGHSHSIDVSGSITDTPDTAVISGTDSDSTLIEDHNVFSGTTLETNQHQLHVQDPDAGEALFTPTGTASGSGAAATGSWVAGDNGVGQFILHADGRWVFKCANADVQHLKAGEIGTDTITVHSADGTAHVLTASVTGTNDQPVIDATSAVTAVEAGHTAHKGQITVTDVDTGDTAAYTAITPTTGQHIAGFTLNANGSYKFDATDAGYDHLALGKTEQVSVAVTVTDAAGETDQKDLIITITGTNDRPTVVSSLAQHIHSIDEDTTQHFTAKDFAFIDKDHGDQLDHITITALPDPYKGHFEYDGHPLTIPLDVLPADISKLTFVPAQDYNGGVQFGFTVNDGHTDSFPKIGNFEVTPVDDISTVSGVSTLAITEGSAANTHADLTVAKGAWLGNVDGTFNFPDVVPNDPHAGRWYAITGAGIAGGAAHGMRVETTQWVMNMGDPNYGHNGYMTFTRNTDHATASYNGGDRVEGDLLITDPDSAPATFIDVTDSIGDGGYGTFSMHNGHWSFVASDKAVALADGATAKETFTFNTSDGVTHQVTVNLTGSDTKAEFKGDISANLKEANIGDNVSAHGTLNIVDVDTGQNPTIADFHDISGTNAYGHFSMVNNQWTYEIDQTKVQHLNPHESVQDKIIVTASDGTKQEIVVNIRGTNDAPVAHHIDDINQHDSSDGTSIRVVLPANAFTDVDHSDTLSLSASLGDGSALPSWLKFDAATGSLSGKAPHSADGDFDVKIIATDSNGGQASHDFHLTVTDMTGDVKEDGRATGIDYSVNGQLETHVVSGGVNQSIVWHEHQDGTDASPNHMQGTYGFLQMSTGGTWIYHVDHDGDAHYSNSAINALKGGEVVQESFNIFGYVNGALVKTDTITVHVKGTNDAATINGVVHSTSSGSLTEDDATSTLTGSLNLADADHGENLFIADPNIVGTYGHVALAADGSWTYQLDNNLPATNALNTGDVVTDTITIQSPDGTADHTIEVNITGHSDTNPTASPASPAPPVTQHDEPEPVIETADITIQVSDYSIDQVIPASGAALYLQALGIELPEHSQPVMAGHDDLPNDMDILFAQDDASSGLEAGMDGDLADELTHQTDDKHHDQQQDDNHQHHLDVDGLPDIDHNS
ncbi:VCBS domain-containing protein [Vibrio sp. F74]|uniref:VCBS domain-containing protein n=1 Tax=Vibrio sp. F74 TaxID=700020 RepID=UPI0035F5785E